MDLSFASFTGVWRFRLGVTPFECVVHVVSTKGLKGELGGFAMNDMPPSVRRSGKLSERFSSVPVLPLDRASPLPSASLITPTRAWLG